MIAGHEYETFMAKDGRKVILRALRFEDLDDLLYNINSLVDEGADIGIDEKQTRESEIEWLTKELALQENGKQIILAAEVDGAVVATSSVQRYNHRSEAHKGTLGIAIRSGYRNIGIGTEMIKLLIEESRNAGLRILLLAVFETNKMARHVYEKIGFKEAGRVPKGIFRNGKYIDDLTMFLDLSSHK
jgi:RimJ/RimL family protein N-acetyltransferase